MNARFLLLTAMTTLLVTTLPTPQAHAVCENPWRKSLTLGVARDGSTLQRVHRRHIGDEDSEQYGAQIHYLLRDSKGKLRAKLSWCAGTYEGDNAGPTCGKDVPRKTWTVTQGSLALFGNVALSRGLKSAQLLERLLPAMKMEPLRQDKRLRRACPETDLENRCMFYLGSGKTKKLLHTLKTIPDGFDRHRHTYRGRLMWHPWIKGVFFLEIYHRGRFEGSFPNCDVVDVDFVRLKVPMGYVPPKPMNPKKP